MPLIDKVTTITDNIINSNSVEAQPCEAKFGFWGVPPNDLDILRLFPDEINKGAPLFLL